MVAFFDRAWEGEERRAFGLAPSSGNLGATPRAPSLALLRAQFTAAARMRARFPHAFAPYRAGPRRTAAGRRRPQRLTTTRRLLTLPLASKTRKEMVCSPALASGTESLYVSRPLSAMPSSGKTECHSPLSTLRSAR